MCRGGGGGSVFEPGSAVANHSGVACETSYVTPTHARAWMHAGTRRRQRDDIHHNKPIRHTQPPPPPPPMCVCMHRDPTDRHPPPFLQFNTHHNTPTTQCHARTLGQLVLPDVHRGPGGDPPVRRMRQRPVQVRLLFLFLLVGSVREEGRKRGIGCRLLVFFWGGKGGGGKGVLCVFE